MDAWQVVTHGEPSAALARTELPDPEPGPGRALVEVLTTGVGLPDVLMCRGTYPLTPPLPFIAGQEIVGRVIEVGTDCDLEVGERIMTVSGFLEGHGGFATRSIVPSGVHRVPETMNDVDAAAFTIPYMTGWTGLVSRGRLKRGETLVVLGAAGGTGAAAVALGRALGARVVAVVGDDRKAEYCRSLGADETIVHADADVAAEIRRLTDGQGADLIYDPVGGAATEEAVPAIATGGRLLTVGFASGRWPKLDVLDVTIRSYSVVGVLAGAGADPAMFSDLFDLASTGAIASPVTSVVSFDDVPAALEELAQRRAVGKTVIQVAL